MFKFIGYLIDLLISQHPEDAGFKCLYLEFIFLQLSVYVLLHINSGKVISWSFLQI